MLNPSTADERRDDPTIRRCTGFARSLGYGGIHVVNLFAFRARHPRQLFKAADPVGPANDKFIARAARSAGRVVAAWGCHGAHRERDRIVTSLLVRMAASVVCLGRTLGGQPRHPLYISGASVLVPFATEKPAND
jgi:hypothetical protein